MGQEICNPILSTTNELRTFFLKRKKNFKKNKKKNPKNKKKKKKKIKEKK